MLKAISGYAAIAMLTAALSAGDHAFKFELSSTDVHEGKMIPMANVYSGMGCMGQNMSPELSWKGAPEGTKSYAVTMYDPDAPTGSGWWHWVVYNIPASTTSLPAGAGDASKNLLPTGATQGNTDFGTPGYGGPCPPAGIQGPSLSDHGVRAEGGASRSAGRRDGGVRGIQSAREHAGEGGVGGGLQEINPLPVSSGSLRIGRHKLVGVRDSGFGIRRGMREGDASPAASPESRVPRGCSV